MEQLTVRGFGPEVERRLRELADRENISLSQAAMRLIRRGAGLEPMPAEARAIGGALDDFIGSWTDEQAREFEEALNPLEQVDPELWQ